MKRTILIIILLAAITLSGCAVFKGGKSSVETVKELGIAYTEGNYMMEGASCNGWITSSRENLCLYVPVSKRLLETQKVSVTAFKDSSIRTVDGNVVVESKVDLSDYIYSAQVKNDGACIFVTLRNENGWKGSDGKPVTNNTPIIGFCTIEFSVTE